MFTRSVFQIFSTLAVCLILNILLSAPTFAQEMNWPERISSNIVNAIDEANSHVVVTIDGELQCNYGDATVPIQAEAKTFIASDVIWPGWGEVFECECSVDMTGCRYVPTVVAACPQNFMHNGSECPRSKNIEIERITLLEDLRVGPFKLSQDSNFSRDEYCAHICHRVAADEAAPYATQYCVDPPLTEIHQGFSCEGRRADLPPLGVPNLTDIAPAYIWPNVEEMSSVVEQAHSDFSIDGETSSSISEQQWTAFDAGIIHMVIESVDLLERACDVCDM